MCRLHIHPNMASISEKVVKVKQKVGHDRLFKDKVYVPADWELQKSWKRFLPQPIISLRVLWGFSWVVMLMTFIAVCICLYHDWLTRIGAPQFWQNNIDLWQPFNLSSFCLALLLVHRTTAAYNRWWEARILWGSVLNLCRNAVREAACSWAFPPEEKALLEMFARWVICMPYCLKAHIRKTSAKEELRTLLPPQELDFLFSSPEPCQQCAQVCASIVGNALPGPEHKVTRSWIDNEIMKYIDIVGGCERIYKTAIPVAFTRHLARFLMVWLAFLPFALWPVLGWATPFVEFLMSFLLVGTENIGIQVEEPFSIMTVDAFCKGIEATVRDILKSYEGCNDLVNAVQAANTCKGFDRNEAWGVEAKTLAHKRVSSETENSSSSATGAASTEFSVGDAVSIPLGPEAERRPFK